MMKTKTIIIRPKDISANLIYSCPNCNNDHWVSVKAAQVVGYMVVCECGQIFKTKPVKNIKIVYKQKRKKEATNTVPQQEINNENNQISSHMLGMCIDVLSGYGYTKSESEDIILKTFAKHPIEDISQFIKLCFQTIGDSINE